MNALDTATSHTRRGGSGIPVRDPILHCPGTAADDDAAVALAVAIGRAEVAAVASVLPDTRKLVPVAEAEGVTPATFSHEDLRLIWCAADVARHRPLLDVLRLARHALREVHHWDPRGPFGTGSRWSNETLAQLAEMYPPCVAAVRANARHLVSLARRWQAAEDLLKQFRDLLNGGDVLPPPSPPRRGRRPAFVLAPGKRGAA